MSEKAKILAAFGWPLLPVNRLDERTSARVVDRVIRLMQSGQYNFVLFSGGVFLPPDIQTRPWGEIARDAAIAAGVDPCCTLVETESVDTYDNIRYSLDVIRQNGIHNFALTVCTHPIHGRRIRYTANVLHGVDVRIEPVGLRLTFGELMWQELCVAYHYWDTHGTGWYRRHILEKRSRMVRIS